VESFANIESMLNEKGATKGKEVVTMHYYGQHEGNDVTKLVEYADRFEIHQLKETNGQFTFLPHIPVASKDAGLQWLKDKGYTTVNIVKMANTDYPYKNGTIGLYVIDDFLHSVILYYPPEDHEAVEQEFGLENAEVIILPYNKYLDKLGRLRSMKLN
jgi:hypothetical protein